MSAVPTPIRTGRLRRRLAIAFVLVGGLSAGALAVGSYLVVRHSLLSDSTDRALTQAHVNLALARSTLHGDPADLTTLLHLYASRPGFVTVAVIGGRHRTGTLPIPAGLHRLVARNDVAYQRETVAGTPYVVVGAPTSQSGTALYFYFAEHGVWHDLAVLERILVGGWIVVVLVSGVVGILLARRTLAPVAQASAAARSLAEGLLDTRLPRGGADEFGAWAASFNGMAEALETKITELSEARERERRFTADVAHELRTPLTALVNEAALLRGHAAEMPADAARLSELVATDVARLRRTAEDLMEISRLDAGTEPVHTAPVSAEEAVRAMIAARGWTDAVTVDGGGRIVTDVRRLERVLVNLIGNAIEHGGGTCSVRIAEDARRFEVADTGPGVPEEHLGRIFDRFAKVDPARTGAGSGLGLAIAADNARLLGGTVEVESRAGHGATFTLLLPDHRPVSEEAVQ
ncbi:MAG TPA: HAMP domain-containing sensor histidine kinase [Gaiellales bacterium]|nr:HAMP domain-containing sensor histidine kinase [Gaiellales bacterium]